MASIHDQLVYSYSPVDGCDNFSCLFTIYYTKNAVWERYDNIVCRHAFLWLVDTIVTYIARQFACIIIRYGENFKELV